MTDDSKPTDTDVESKEIKDEINNLELGELPELEKLDVVIPKLKMIKFGDEFEEWDTGRKIRYLKRLASSMNQAADLLQKERNALLVKNDALQKQAEYANNNAAQNKVIMINALNEYNAERQELVAQIQRQETRIKAQDVTIETLNAKLKEQKGK